MGSRDLDL